MKAAVVVGVNDVQVKDIEKPNPGVGEVLVKVVSVAQNPTDWKHVNNPKIGKPGSIVGCDFAGTVEVLGSAVPADARQIGERVAGFVHGSYHENHGAFAEYVVTDALLVSHIPDAISFDDAAGLGCAALTTAQMLWQSLELPFTPSHPCTDITPILVWSGASGVGQFVVQFAHLSGLHVITTASPKHHEYLKSLGAQTVFDYRDPEVAQKIKQQTGGKLTYAADCISEGDSPKLIAESMGDEGGKVAIILPYKPVREEVKPIHSLAYTLLGKPVYSLPANPEHHENGKKYSKAISDVLASGKFKFPPPKIFPKGLASVAEGLEFHKAGKVSGEKITYRIADTP